MKWFSWVSHSIVQNQLHLEDLVMLVLEQLF